MLLYTGEESIPSQKVVVDDELQELVLSEEVQNVIAGKSDKLNEKGSAELSKFEEMSKAFIARQRALVAKAAPATSPGGFNVQSITPKV
jgi:hypothetical protein